MEHRDRDVLDEKDAFLANIHQLQEIIGSEFFLSWTCHVISKPMPLI